MALTLNDIKVGKADKVDQAVIDEFIRNSELLASMPFDDAVSPHGGSTMTYGYIRTKHSPAASGREIGSDYTPAAAKKEKATTDLVIMGKSYEIDRVLAESAPDEVAYQTSEAIKATVNRFHWLVINGRKENSTEFDGLAEIVDGTSTDFDASGIDASSITEAVALKITEALDTAILAMNEKPDLILANSKAIVKLRSSARILGYLTAGEDSFGRPVDTYNGVRFMDMGRYYDESIGSDTEVIPIDDASGKTNIYLVSLGQGGMLGVTLSGDKSVSSRMPNFNEAGAVKKGDVEFVASIAVKNTRAVARLENIKVQSTLSVLKTLAVSAEVNKVTVTPNKPKIGNAYYYKTSKNASVTPPTANTAIVTGAGNWVAFPANGVIAISGDDHVGIVEIDKGSSLPVAYGVADIPL